jgi:endonuclease YncB( thermonuclease family)
LPEPIGSGKVSAVADARTFRLEDGREVRLAGVEAPGASAAGDPQAASAVAARAALRDLIDGQTVTLRRLGGDADRYGRVLAHVAVGPEGAQKGVQQALLTAGFARVGPNVEHATCRTEFLAGEQAARAGKLGLWADPYYDVRKADNPAAILAEIGRFAVIEGKVLSVRESGGTIYMNFGRRWTEGFAVTILKRQERVFAAAGIEPKKLEGREIRVRGWIEQRGGPRLEAARPEQIEIVGR